jgi:DNA polymerase III delta subunit-like protein
MTPEQVRAHLAGSLPPATLVRGADAWELAASAAAPGWQLRADLDMAAVREVLAAAYLLPSAADARVYLMSLDGASAMVQNALLKVLEEPLPTSRFVLSAAADAMVLPTIASRCRLLPLARSRASVAFDARARGAVAAAIDAAREGRHAELAALVRGWWSESPLAGQSRPPHLHLLEAWAAEAASGRWARFDPGFAPGVRPAQALRLLGELARCPGARLGPTTALDRAFSGG